MSTIASVRAAFLASIALAAEGRAQTTAQTLLFPSPYFHETGAKQGFLLADFDYDGILDITGSSGVGTFGILPGNGDGTFGSPVDTGSPVGGSLVADFDGDGMSDLAGALGQQVVIVHATGPLAFGIPTGVSVPGPVNSLDIGDANADGFLDIVASVGGSSSAPYPKVLAMMLGNGLGGISQPLVTGVGGVPADLVMRDLDGDAALDLAVVDDQLEMLRVFLGAGDGGIYAAGQYPTADEPRAIASGDWNGDGAMDAAVSTYMDIGEDVSVFMGTGRGTFVTLPPVEVGSSYSQSIVAADFDQDGRDDVAMASTSHVAILLQDFAVSGFDTETRYAGPSSIGLAVGDLNGDGWLDLASGSYYGFSVLLAAPGGALLGATGPTIPTLAPPASPSTSTVVIEDFDGDGRLDLAGSLAPYTVPGMPGNLRVALGDGGGSFTALHPAQIPGHVRATGDLDVDGVPDLLVASISFVSPTFGAGDGTFSVSPSIYGLDGLGTGVVADLDGDGAPDAVLPAPSSYAVSVLLNNGDGTLGAPLGYGVGKIHGSVAVGDLDLDGDPELVSGEGSQFIGLHVFEGVGDGTFLPPVTTPLPFVGAVEVRDHDQDGKLDVALVSKGRLFVLAGDGAGGLGPPMPLSPLGSPVGSFAFADLDGVGTIDLTAGTSNGVGVFLGQPDGTLGPSTVFGPYGVPRAAELNGDGRVDIAVASGGMLCVLFHQGEAPAITAVGGLPASSSGSVLVQGGPFDAATVVKVDGAPAPFDLLGPSELGLALGASVPGLYDVEIAGTFGSALAGDALERWPSLAAGPATIGQPLALDLESGGAGPFALALSGGLLGAPLAIPDVYYGLWLSPAHLISAGSVAPGQTGTSLSVAVPADPGLSGATVYFQAWAWPIGLALAPPSSFSNFARVIVP